MGMPSEVWHNPVVGVNGRRGPGRPPAVKSAETRKRILRVAREVFREIGYDAATFQAIAVRADLTRPAINHYFPNKQLLYREVVAETSNHIAAGIEQAKQETTLIGRLTAFITIAVQAESQDRSTAAFLVTAVLESQRHPELELIDGNSLLSSREFLTWTLNEAVASGEISADADIASLVELLTAVLWGLGFYAGFVGSRQELEVVTGNLRSLLTGALGNDRQL